MDNEVEESIFRILDAAANRVGEGLRTMEEWARFGLDDAALSASFKTLRHDFASVISGIARHKLLMSRDTVDDVGTAIGTAAEYSRSNHRDVIAAAAGRTGQSLRVLEEYSKTISGELAGQIEQIRYRFYTASAQLELLLAPPARKQLIHTARFYVLIESMDSDDLFASHVRSLCEVGVDVLQIRDPNASDRQLIERGKLAAEITDSYDTLMIMNDRVDLALAANCDGVHVGQDELPLRDARAIAGDDILIGVSTHNVDQAIAAEQDGADYIGCGPVFPGRTKSFDDFPGLGFIRSVAPEITVPAFAIGGIDETNLNDVIDAGIRRVAVTGAIRDSESPSGTAKRIKAMLEDSERVL